MLISPIILNVFVLILLILFEIIFMAVKRNQVNLFSNDARLENDAAGSNSNRFNNFSQNIHNFHLNALFIEKSSVSVQCWGIHSFSSWTIREKKPYQSRNVEFYDIRYSQQHERMLINVYLLQSEPMFQIANFHRNR